MIGLTSNGRALQLNPPQYPYTVTINMCMRSIEAVYGRIHWLDQGKDYDGRSVDVKWLLNYERSQQLQDMMTDEARENDVRFTCPDDSGFFAFGPDKGDAGFFWGKLNEVSAPGMKYKPYRHFETSTVFNMISTPEYEIPSAPNEGKFQLGAVSGIRQMQREINNIIDTGVNRNESISGKITTVDLTDASDIYDADIQILAGTHKMAEIIRHIQIDIRGNTFAINNQCNNFLFGATRAASDEYEVILRDNKLVCNQIGFNRWTLDLKLRLVA